MKVVDIVFRSHSGPNVHGGTRVFKGPKQELILGCLRSLLRSALAVDPRAYTLRLAILDDHSLPSCVHAMKALIGSMPFATRFVPISGYGVGASFGAGFEYGREQLGEIIYFVEDDYLHTVSALSEMLEAQEVFSRRLGGREVAIFPVDYPDNYDPRWMQPSYLVLGPRRHWHTDFSTTGTFMLSRAAFLKNFEHCMGMSRYMIDPGMSEQTSINNIWRNGVQLFSPVPTLAIHMQDGPIISAFTDWKKWWELYALPGADLKEILS